MLVCAVVIHHPDFFGAGAGTDECDLGRGDTWQTAGEFADDFVGELMGEFADLGIGRCTAIDFGDDGLRGGIVDIIEPGLNCDFGRGFRDITKGHVVGFDLRISPSGVLEFGRLTERLRGVEAGTDEIENAAKGEIIADDLGELTGVGLGVVGARTKIGDGYADFLSTETSGCVKPGLRLLRAHRSNLKTKSGQDKQSE